MRVICNGGLTAVVTFLASGEENVELFIALSASGLGTDEFWWGATEER